METLSAATVGTVVGVDADSVLRTRVVHSARRLTHTADTCLGQSAVLVDVADYYMTRGQRKDSQERARVKESSK